MTRTRSIAMGALDHSQAEPASPARGARFATTQWGLVSAAGESLDASGRQALNELLDLYWFPLYAHVRRRGYPPEDAEDLTQGFLCEMVSRQRLRHADATRGRFRSFLLASLHHFLSNERAARGALKRGGGVRLVPFTSADAERRWQSEQAAGLSPERAYDLHWVLNLLRLVLARMREELTAAGHAALFETLKPFLTTEAVPPQYGEIASALGMTEPAARMAVHRLRQRYRVLVREEIARTLADPALVESELQSLLSALRGAT